MLIFIFIIYIINLNQTLSVINPCPKLDIQKFINFDKFKVLLKTYPIHHGMKISNKESACKFFKD